jgi:hypothetical protein
MKSLLTTLTVLTALSCFGQKERIVSTFLSIQGSVTQYDRTKSNNSGAFGFGVQATINTKTWIRPTVEVNGDLSGGTKELITTNDGKIIESKQEVLGIYAGPLFQPIDWMFVSATAGNSIYNDKSHFGIRPSIGFFPFHHQRVEAKASFTYICQRDDISNKSFGYLSFGIGIKII